RNITERKRIEEELRARQDMIDLAQQAARAAAFEWRIGSDAHAARSSPDLVAMLGADSRAFAGSYEAWKRLVHPGDRVALQVAIALARETGDLPFEYRVARADAAARWLQLKGRVSFDDAGEPARIVGFMLDVTERHQAEEDL